MLLSVYQSSPHLLTVVVAVIGACVGSFLNVVIYRVPLILKHHWEKPGEHCELSLWHPRSHCLYCHQTLVWWQLLPFISFIALRGRCGHCDGKISYRYPAVELLSALISGFVTWHVGALWSLPFILLFSWFVLALFFIDYDHQLLPDSLTLPLIWLGLIANTCGLFSDLHSAVIGAVVGYLSLWLVFWLFKLLTGKEGLGYGDFKLFAAIGAWVGWQLLPLTLLMAGILGLLFVVLRKLCRRTAMDQAIAFGPALIIAGWLALVWGPALAAYYWLYTAPIVLGAS